MTKRNRPQSDLNQERARAVRKLAGTMSNWEIAKKLGITITNLQYIAHKNNISLRFYRDQWSDARKAELLEMVRQGMSSPAIGKHYGISRAAVDIQLVKMRKEGTEVPSRTHNLGGYRVGHEWTEDRDACLIALWPNHRTKEIAERLDTTANAVTHRACELRRRGADLPRKRGGREQKL